MNRSQTHRAQARRNEWDPESRVTLQDLDRNWGALRGSIWLERMRDKGREAEVRGLIGAVLGSNHRGSGDAVYYVRSCARGPLGGVYAALRSTVADFALDFDDEEAFRSEDYAIGFIQGVLNGAGL